jgi:hypothetical protein
MRDAFLEETTALNVRNEELAQLSAQYARRMDHAGAPPAPPEKRSGSFDRMRQQQPSPGPAASISSSTVGSFDESFDNKYVRVQKPEITEATPTSKGKFMKWPGSKPKDVAQHPAVVVLDPRGKAHREHTFQQLSVLRFAITAGTRCGACN